MKKNLALALIILSINGFAQNFGGGVSFQGGVTYQRITVEGNLEHTVTEYDHFSSPYDTLIKGEIYESRGLAGLSFNINASILKFSDDFSVGNTTELKLGGWGNPYGFYLFTNVPSYLTIRYGANSTNDSERKIGVGIGVGYQLGLHYLGGTNFNYAGFFPDYSVIYLQPSAIIDFNYYRNNGKTICLRANTMIGEYHDTKGSAEKNNEFWRNWGLTFLWNF